jgi:adenosylcobinamide amidohydrolase
MGIRTTLCHTRSAIFKYCIRLPQWADMEETGTKKGRGRKEVMKSKRKSLPYMTESTEIDCRQRLKEVGIDNEDKELMDEGNNVRYLRMN